MLLLRKLIIACFTGLALLLSANSQAIMVAESGDAGDLTGTAQILSDGTDSVTGTIESDLDADLYGFSWGGGLLTIDTFGAGTLDDTQLFLFDSVGNLLAENDDSGSLRSQISDSFVAGDYFIGISAWNNDPTSDPLSGWDNGGIGSGTGTYTITFSAPTGASVPEPGTLVLLGVGLAGLGFTRRVKKTQPVSQ